MLEEVNSDTLTCVGGADGAGRKDKIYNLSIYHTMCLLPPSAVVPMTLLSIAILAVIAVTVMV